jgi:hypothetical protein
MAHALSNNRLGAQARPAARRAVPGNNLHLGRMVQERPHQPRCASGVRDGDDSAGVNAAAVGGGGTKDPPRGEKPVDEQEPPNWLPRTQFPRIVQLCLSLLSFYCLFRNSFASDPVPTLKGTALLIIAAMAYGAPWAMKTKVCW